MDPISLAFGLIFCVLGLAFLLGDLDASTLSGAWAWAGSFGVFGVLLVAIGLRWQRR
jgi:hypothetical protein